VDRLAAVIYVVTSFVTTLHPACFIVLTFVGAPQWRIFGALSRQTIYFLDFIQ
jgi:hypothetical protein